MTNVKSTVNYLGAMSELPVFYSENVQKNNLELVEHGIELTDARPMRDELSLKTNGFVLVDHVSEVTDLRDGDAMQRVYADEIGQLIRELTGAVRVIVLNPVWRYGERSEASGVASVNSRPARFVHVDYSRASFDEFAASHLRNHGCDPALLQGRYAAYNIWRVMTPPPQDVPLGVCEASTVAAGDVERAEAVIDAPGAPEIRFGSSLYHYNPAHRWYWFSDMTPREALVFKAFDSDRDRVQGCPHSAFDDPSCPDSVPPRASVEIRAFAYFGRGAAP